MKVRGMDITFNHVPPLKLGVHDFNLILYNLCYGINQSEKKKETLISY